MITAKNKKVAAKIMIELFSSLKISASFNFNFNHLINLIILKELKQQQKQQQQEQKMKKQKKKKKINKINQNMKLRKLNKLRRSNKLRKLFSFEQSLTMQFSNFVENDDLLKYVQWHILQKKKRRETFMIAYIELNAWNYNLQTLQFWKNKFETY